MSSERSIQADKKAAFENSGEPSSAMSQSSAEQSTKVAAEPGANAQTQANNKKIKSSRQSDSPVASSSIAGPSTKGAMECTETSASAQAQQSNISNTQDVLAALNVDVRSQEDQEREVAAKLAELHKAAEDHRDQKLIDRTLAKIEVLATKKRNLEDQLGARGMNIVGRKKISEAIDSLLEQHKVLYADLLVTQDRMNAREADYTASFANAEVDYSQVPKPGESRDKFLVRIGKITPFAMAKAQRQHRPQNELEEELREAEDEDELKKQAELTYAKPQSHQHLQKPGFLSATKDCLGTPALKIDFSKISAKKRASTTRNKDIGTTPKKRSIEDAAPEASKRSRTPEYATDDDLGMFGSRADEAENTSAGESATASRKRLAKGVVEASTTKKQRRRKPDGTATSSVEASKLNTPNESDASFVENDVSEDEDESSEEHDDAIRGKKQRRGSRKSMAAEEVVIITDDGDEKAYQERLENWTKERNRVRKNTEGDGENDNRPEWEKSCPTAEGHTMESGITVPGDIYGTLFDYQKVGVQWFCELYSQGMGGILADEMGLGKTIQVIAMLASLHHSGELKKPALIVCPGTVMQQWVNEFHKWWPALRVSILHSSGAGMVNLSEESRHDDDFDHDARVYKALPKAQRAAKGIVNRVLEKGHVLVTTYAGLETYNKLLTDVEWQYAVLDEGHKIKNPDTAVTLLCKNLTTRNRIILSGTPMQNNMTEIWSLMDFVHPGILGTLVDFRINFEEPINRGHHKSCTNLERKIAETTAGVLKNTISQQLLQRVKLDVASDLPKKTEQTLLCKFTVAQAKAYRNILSSEEVAKAKSGRSKPMEIIDKLQKICNHPDLLDESLQKKPGYNWGDPDKSGKMEVTKQLIRLSKEKGEKMLLFSQSVKMMVILEKTLKGMANIRYLVMHGETPLAKRSLLVERFQTDPEIDVFLLSTRVGGLGLNLTAANGVIIFDPSWNPATDSQARERAWRLGQKKPVTVYRLMCKGAIEEKMYQRQLYKTKLTEKVLRDATSQNNFDPKDLQDLFSFENDEPNGKAADYTQGAERRIEGDWSSDTKYNKDRIENGTTLEKDGAAQARYAKDPKKFRNKPTIEEALAAEKSKKRESDDARGTQNPTPPRTNNAGVSPDIFPPDARRQKMSQLEAEQWETLEQVKGISGVGGMYTTQYLEEENSAAAQQKTLDSIFAISGVHSVLQHDAILKGNMEKPDMRYINADAEKAKKEAEALIKRNAEAAKSQRAGTVTWTGRHGEAGRRPERAPVESRNRWRVGGSRSARSTANPSRFQTPIFRVSACPMGSREATPASRGATPASRDATPAPMTSLTQPPQRQYEQQIRAFIRAQAGSAPTQMVSNHFNHMLKSDDQRKKFKRELVQMCDIASGPRGQGQKRWVLKAQFR